MVQAPAPPSQVGESVDRIALAEVPAPVAAPPAVGTTGVPARCRRVRSTTARRPEGLNGVFIEYGNQRYFSDGPAVRFDETRFTRVGEYRGFPVYGYQGHARTVYIPALGGSPGVVAPYRAEVDAHSRGGTRARRRILLSVLVTDSANHLWTRPAPDCGAGARPRRGRLRHVHVAADSYPHGRDQHATHVPNRTAFNLVNRLSYAVSQPSRGDVVAIRLAGPSVVYVKRIVGLPGERVAFRQGRRPRQRRRRSTSPTCDSGGPGTCRR